jgi:1,4-dihydroxy-6-naphthoate synthase
LAATPESTPRDTSQLTLCPGRHTTAALLFALFHPESTRVEQAVFSEIMPRLQAGSADFGVCIHEGRFTWQQQGLTLVEDLGLRWEAETSLPLPLGGIVASQSLPADTIARVQGVIADSLRFALANPAAPLPTMRDHAQELDDAVLMQHVDLYVNDQTLDLGPLGQRALDELCVRAAAVGLGSGGRLEIFPG